MYLTAADLRFGYTPERPLFRGLSFDLAARESLSIVAPSGRGKTTLLKVLAGYLTPDQGAVTIDGVPAAHASSSVAWIFQSSTLLPHRTSTENVALPLLARGYTRETAHTLARERLARMGLSAHVDVSVKSLSGGEAQRVGVARGLCWPASLVLADEPTANLDRDNAELVADALFDTGNIVPVVVVTHDLDIARRASRILDLNDYAPDPQ